MCTQKNRQLTSKIKKRTEKVVKMLQAPSSVCTMLELSSTVLKDKALQDYKQRNYCPSTVKFPDVDLSPTFCGMPTCYIQNIIHKVIVSAIRPVHYKCQSITMIYYTAKSLKQDVI